jgi:ribosomal protein S3
MDSNNIYKDTWIKSLNIKLEKAFNSKEGRFLFLAQYRLNDLAILLSKLLQKNVELELVRLKYPYHDSNILAQLIGINGRKLTYGRIKKVLFRKATISTKSVETNQMGIQPSDFPESLSLLERTSRLTGLKIRIAGRLNRQRVVPKRTVKTAYKGGISKTENNLVDTATYTSKNRKGAVSVRV